QDVEALEEECVNGEEVALQDARRLPAQELRPARLLSLRSRLDPCLPQDRPDRARREFDPESNQLALDPPVAPGRVLARESRDERADLSCCSRSTRATLRL